MKGESAARFVRHLNLTAGDCAIAQDTNALIVERMPFPAQIGRLEERELVFWPEWCAHFKGTQIKVGQRWFGNRHRL
jgi:hypothetical protein